MRLDKSPWSTPRIRRTPREPIRRLSIERTCASVAAYGLPSGRPLSGATVVLVTTVDSGTGGHAHDAQTRPLGTFFTMRENPNDTGYSRPRLAVQLDSAGRSGFVYRTSGVSGREWDQTRQRESLGARGFPRSRS
jgi:hypothetical protein